MSARYLNHAIGIVIIFAALGLAYAAYAASQLNISNDVNVKVGVNLQAFIVPADQPAPICAANTPTTVPPGTGRWSENGLTLTWNLNQGAIETRYVCLSNIGTVTDAMSFSYNPSPLPNGLTITNQFGICSNGSCVTGNSISPQGFALATIVLTASQTSVVGQTVGAFTITIT